MKFYARRWNGAIPMGVLCKAVSYAQQMLRNAIKPGFFAVDATAGNGHDTEFLARMVGPTGRVFAFDIQKNALEKTRERLAKGNLLEQVTFCHAGHEFMRDWVDVPIQAVMFNLGYLPGADHEVITKPQTTVTALGQASELLSPGGLITVVIYPGHPGGQAEREAVEGFTVSLPQRQYTVIRYEILNQVNNPPLMLAIEKLDRVGES